MKSAASLANHVVHHGLHGVPAPHHSYHAEGMVIHCWRGLPGGDVLYAEGIEAQVVDPGQSHMTVKGKTVHLPRWNPREMRNRISVVIEGSDSGDATRNFHAQYPGYTILSTSAGRRKTSGRSRYIEYTFTAERARQNPAPLTPTYLHTKEDWSLGYKGYRTNPMDSGGAAHAIDSGNGSFTFERDNSNRVFLKLQGYGYIARIEIVNRDRHHPHGELLITPENAGVDANKDAIVNAMGKASLGAGWAATAKKLYGASPIEMVAVEMGTTPQVLSGEAGYQHRDMLRYPYKGPSYRTNPRNAPLARQKVPTYGDVSVHPPQPKNAYWNIYIKGKEGTEAHYAWHEPNLLAEQGFWSEKGRPPERLMHFCVELGLPEEARNAPTMGR